MPVDRMQKIAQRVQETIVAMPLDELRKARQMTLAKLAQSLGVVSKIEYRTDRYLSTGDPRSFMGYLDVFAYFLDSNRRGRPDNSDRTGKARRKVVRGTAKARSAIAEH